MVHIVKETFYINVNNVMIVGNIDITVYSCYCVFLTSVRAEAVVYMRTTCRYTIQFVDLVLTMHIKTSVLIQRKSLDNKGFSYIQGKIESDIFTCFVLGFRF